MKKGLIISVYSLVLLHTVFVAFVIFGGLWTLLNPAVWVWHLPVLAWALLVEFMRWPCPLTIWENTLRRQAGMLTYTTGFVEHYLIAPVLGDQPHSLLELLLTVGIVAVNLGAYLFLWLG